MRSIAPLWQMVLGWLGRIGRSAGLEDARQRNARAAAALDAALKEVLHR